MAEKEKNLEQLILASRNKFRALVDGLEDAMMSIDSNYRIISVNRALAEQYGRHPRELIGQTCHQVLYGNPSPCPEWGRTCQAFLARQSGHVEIGYLEVNEPEGLDGGHKFFEIRAMPLGDSNEGEIVLLRRDVTLKMRAEIKLKEQNDYLEQVFEEKTRELVVANQTLTHQRNELERTNDELLRLQILKKDLTNMVIHDLKGPLSEIMANLEILRADPLSEMQEECLEAAKLGSSELQRMITNLLDISRMEENRMVIEKSDFDPVRLLEETRERYTPLARLNLVTIKVEAQEGMPEIFADFRLFERIFNNLVSNALDYTPESGNIFLRVSHEDGRYQFEVQDNGHGIPPEFHEKIFLKFSQGQPGRPKTSSGLGLTFCKMAVEAHGGRIWVESEPGRGSTFTFVVPETDDALPETFHE